MKQLTKEIIEDVPEMIPRDWVVNPHNNPDISLIGKIDKRTGKKWTPSIRENWISPESLKKICPDCNHERKTNAYLTSANVNKFPGGEE